MKLLSNPRWWNEILFSLTPIAIIVVGADFYLFVHVSVHERLYIAGAIYFVDES